MDNKKFILTTKAKIIFGILAGVFLISLIFAGVYSNGSKTIDEPNMSWVSHTEYWRGDNASTIVRLADYKGDPYTVNNCNVTILYPDKTTFVNNGEMNQSNIVGNWYRTDSLVNAPLGTYEQEVTCITPKGQTVKSSQSFHLNPALEEIKTVSEKLTDQNINLTNTNIEIIGKLADSNQIITAKLDNLNTNLSNILFDVNTNMKNDFTNTNTNINTKFSELTITLNTNITDLNTNINTKISDLDISLTNLIENNLKADINNQITSMTTELKLKLDKIQEDTNWLINNAMNQDYANIQTNFDDLNIKLRSIMEMCSDTTTNTNKLCTEIQTLSTTINTLKLEQENYLRDINSTTTSTYDLLSVSFSQKIDSILTDIGIIKEQTNDINSTTHEILDNMNNQIDVRIIS